MTIFEDGSYSSLKGIELIAKILAGQCKMRYTRAAVGKGKIPDGETPKTMTAPADYVMDAKIVSVTNPVDGECQVTVQINSNDVEHGFYAAGIVLYAEDPDLGEVPYTYLVLENNPEWIRPSSSAVGKIATFDLVAAVGEVDKVIANLDPDAIVTIKDVQRIVDSATIQRNILIPSDGWTADGEGYVIDIAQDDITSAMIPSVTIVPESIQTAAECGLSATVETVDGALRFRAERVPAERIEASLLIIRASYGYAAGGGSIMPDDAFASDEEVNEMFDEIFGGETNASGDVSTNIPEGDFATDEEANEMFDEIFGN